MKLIRSLATVLLFVFLLPGCQPDSEVTDDLYKAVPLKCSFILETSNIKQSLEKFSQTQIYSAIDSLPFVLDFEQTSSSLLRSFKDDSLNLYFRGNPSLIVGALSGAEKYSLLFISKGSARFEKALGKKWSKDFKVDQREYAGSKIFHFFGEDQKSHYYVSSYKGLLLFSPNAFLLEEGVRQLNNELDLRQDMAFQKLYETANRKDIANLYLNLSQTPGLVKKLLPLGDARFLERLGSWVELDLTIGDQDMILSGLNLLPPSSALYPQSFKGVDAQKTRGQQIVPSGSGLWVSHTFGNAEQYYRSYRDYLNRGDRLRKHDQLLEKLEINTEELLLQWVDTEMGIFASAGKGEQNNQVAYFAYRSEEAAQQALESLANPDFIEGYRGMVIRKLAAENALPRFYGSLFEDFHYPYFVLTNGFVLFAENLAMLKGVINDVLAGKTLAAEPSFVEFDSNFPSKAHIKVVVANPGLLPMLGKLLEGGDAKIMERYSTELNNFRWAALQMIIDGDKAFTDLYLSHKITQREKVSRQWSTQLESQAASVPQFLKNHLNKKYDIAVQDKDHRLYLLDYKGKILWTKILDGPIMGSITQVDLFKNNKLQMVLNTQGRLYVIDRLGRDVENFPVELPESATAPVGVANYDRARNYRFLVPAGKRLLNYNLEGKEVKGWKFKKTKKAIITQPQHFAVKGKDLIVLETEDGKLYQINRAGEKRFNTVEDLPSLRIPFYLKEGESLALSEMLTIAGDGKLYAFRPGKLADKLFLDEENPAEEFLYFDDKYIFSNGEDLFVKSDQRPWRAQMDGDISTKPKAMIFKGDFYVGAFSSEAEEIRLFNKKGELIEGFPVFAQGPFDMGSLRVNSSINVVTYSEDGTLICYVVN